MKDEEQVNEEQSGSAMRLTPRSPGSFIHMFSMLHASFSIPMKQLILPALALALLSACTAPTGPVTLTIKNPLPTPRQGEMAEVSMTDMAERLNLADTAQIVVLDEEDRQVPYQITYDNKLIFPVNIEGKATVRYTVQPGIPDEVPVTACGRQYPERDDDMAWENDLVAFRAYGPALQARGERGFGYDLFAKRGTKDPILDDLYARMLNPDTWAEINRLRRTDPEAARRLEQECSYHVDHGVGMDCYAVGPTLGAGVAALIDSQEEIYYPWCYQTYEVLDNGPLRFTVSLEFAPTTVDGDTAVVERRIISLDAGSHLNKTTVTFDGLAHPMSLVTGIVLHQTDPSPDADTKLGYIACTDPTTGPGQGTLFLGAVLPNGMKEVKVQIFGPTEKRQRNNADGHILAYTDYAPGDEHTYYWGYGWDRADMADAAAWRQYLENFAQQVRHPLEVTYR